MSKLMDCALLQTNNLVCYTSPMVLPPQSVLDEVIRSILIWFLKYLGSICMRVF